MKKKLILIVALCCASVAFAAKHRDKSLSNLCTEQYLEAVLPQPMAFAPVPKHGDEFWQEIPADMKNNFIRQAEYFLDKGWSVCDYDLFAEFRTNGNRTNYEKYVFEKRKRLGSLVMAELMEGKKRFLPEILKGIESLCQEPFWGIPAHYPTSKPTPDVQPLALFSAETGSIAAWIYYLLGDELDKLKPGIAKTLRENVQKRINDEGLRTREWWREANMNWNPWICNNWLTAVLFTEPNRAKQIEAVRQIAISLDGFLDKYPMDGGCDEGCSYWDRAGGSLLDCLVTLDLATNGAISINDDELLQNISEYMCKMNIDNVHFVNFADAYPTVGVRPEWFPGAKLIGCEPLMSLIASFANRKEYFTKPSVHFRADNTTSLNREIYALMNVNDLQKASSEVVLPFDSWLPRLQVITARSYPNSFDGLFLAAKGGHNDESHNHNDVGEFIVYASGQPILVDAGTATYTSKTFTGERYSVWNVQSGYHNLPQINGIDQTNGKDRRAAKVKSSIKRDRVKFSLDIAEAYPADAAVKSWQRSIDFRRGKRIEVTEKYKLNAYKSPTKLNFITQAKPKLGEGTVNIANCSIAYNPQQMEASYEEILLSDQIVKNNWGHLYRLTFTLKSKDLSGKIKYTITHNP